MVDTDKDDTDMDSELNGSEKEINMERGDDKVYFFD